jgi:hypothetical protein
MNTTQTTATRSTPTQILPGHVRFYIYRDGKKPVQVDAVHGSRKCGARCTSSLGPSCSCECGGENHGRDLWG